MVCSYVVQPSADAAFIIVALIYGMELHSPFINHLGDTHFDDHADGLAFSVIVYLVVRSNVHKIPIPSILKTIAQDATYYFLVIFASHLLLMFQLWTASVSTSS